MKKQKSIINFFDITILILSIYVLITIMVDSFFKLPAETSRLLDKIDDIICFVFIFDFIYRFFKAEQKLHFLKWGWIDLISSIPAINVLRYGRLVRVFRILRILRGFRSMKYITNHLFKSKMLGTFSTVALIAGLTVIFGSISILQVETAKNSNITTAEDAIWWSFATVTTVGYGDKYPVTTEGRVIAGCLMVAGVGLFGSFTGFVASWFLNGGNSSEKSKINDLKDLFELKTLGALTDEEYHKEKSKILTND